MLCYHSLRFPSSGLGPLNHVQPTPHHFAHSEARIYTIGPNCLSCRLFDLSRRFLSCIRSTFPDNLQTGLVHATLCFVTFVLRRCVYEISFLAVGGSGKIELAREAGVR